MIDYFTKMNKMVDKILRKINNNLRIYREDLQTKGLYYSILHRLFKIPKLKEILTPLVNYLKPDFIKINNYKLYIDKFDTTVSEKLVETKVWEDFESKIFKQSLKTGDIVVDIGAHIGYYTLIASKIVSREGKVYAFEPDPKNFKLLKRNVEENQLHNVVLTNKAITSKTGQVKLYLNKENTGDHRIYDTKDDRDEILVDSTSLDDYFKNIKRKIDVIKMDIQGAEYEAIMGGLGLLRKNPQIKIFCEFWPMGLKLNNTNPENFLAVFRKFGFRIFHIDEERKRLIPQSADQLIKLYPPHNPDFTNLYILKAR